MTYKVEVDEKTCIGCGSCEHVSDNFFTIEEKEIDGDEKFIAIPKQKTVEEVSNLLNEAKEICPVGAIKITEIKK